MRAAALLLVMGLAVCQPSWAEWSPVARSSRGQYDLDESTVRDTDKGRMAFYLFDLKAPEAPGGLTRDGRWPHDDRPWR